MFLCVTYAPRPKPGSYKEVYSAEDFNEPYCKEFFRLSRGLS